MSGIAKEEKYCLKQCVSEIRLSEYYKMPLVCCLKVC